jgi:hypothetical protein
MRTSTPTSRCGDSCKTSQPPSWASSRARTLTERPRLDPQTRRWLKLEVSRRKEKEVHVGRPVLHRYSQQAASGPLDPSARIVTSSAEAKGNSDNDRPGITERVVPSARPSIGKSAGDDLDGRIVRVGPSQPGIDSRREAADSLGTHAGQACVCGHVRNRKDHQLSRASPCRRRRNADRCYTVPRRTRGRRERASGVSSATTRKS